MLSYGDIILLDGAAFAGKADAGRLNKVKPSFVGAFVADLCEY
jgi:hypothetical protein